MLKKQLLGFLNKRLYLFIGGKLYKIENNQLRRLELSDLRAAFFPVVIIGKEHYRESEKRYPVTNHNDLKDILKYQSVKPSLLGDATVLDDCTLVPQIELDETANQFISSNSWLFWLPESWVLNLEVNQLYQFIRADHQMLAMKTSTKTMVSPMTGPFKSKNYFLMSVGASDSVNELHWSEGDYANHLFSGVEAIKQSTWINLTKAQGYAKKIGLGIDWVALVGGAVMGVLLFQVLTWGYLTFSDAKLTNKITQQNVAEIVALQKKFEESKSALSAIQNGGFDKDKVKNFWALMVELLEEKISVLRVTPQGSEYELYMQSKEATATLEMLRNNALVNSVKFSTPVRQSQGNERFGVLITMNGRGES